MEARNVAEQTAVEKKLVVMLDADGCIYNQYYDLILLHLVQKYPVISRDDIEKVIKEINEIITYDPDSGEVKINYNLIDDLDTLKIKILQNHPYVVNHPDKNVCLTENECKTILAEEKNRFLRSLNFLGEEGRKKLNKHLIYSTNRPLFSEIIKRVQSNQFDSLEVISGSNRQRKETDENNKKRYGTGLFHQDIQLCCDILNDEMKKTNNNSAFKLNPYFCELYKSSFDSSKFALYYSITEEYANKGEATILSFEDSTTIIKSLVNLYKANQDLLCKSIDLELFRYEGEIKKDFKTTSIDNNNQIDLFASEVIKISGTRANPDKNYNQTLLNLLGERAFQRTQREVIFFADILMQYNSSILKRFKEWMSKEIQTSVVNSSTLFTENRANTDEFSVGPSFAAFNISQ